MYYNTYYTF